MKLKAPEGCGGATYGDHTIELDEHGTVDIVHHPELVKTLKDHGFTEVTPESMRADRVCADAEQLPTDAERAEQKAQAESDVQAEERLDVERAKLQTKLEAADAKKAAKPWQKAAV